MSHDAEARLFRFGPMCKVSVSLVSVFFGSVRLNEGRFPLVSLWIQSFSSGVIRFFQKGRFRVTWILEVPLFRFACFFSIARSRSASERERDRETERQRDRETERQRDRERERETRGFFFEVFERVEARVLDQEAIREEFKQKQSELRWRSRFYWESLDTGPEPEPFVSWAAIPSA